MFDESWFGGMPAVGQLSDDEKAAYLAAVGGPEAPTAAAPISLATAIAKSSENRPVQRGLLALDLGRTLVDSAKLRLGSYVLAQAPAEVDGRPWSWNDYVYDQGRNAIVSAHDPAALIPFNYVAVGIAPLHG